MICAGATNFSHIIDHCYRLDGKLVAIGVIDLLPHCVSSVYFLYHESFSKYNPGKLGALREIALAAEQGYRWWYSGYYIHTCPKMKYKIDYSPTYILDPDRYEWMLLNKDMLANFDGRGYLRLPGAREPEPQGPPPGEQKLGGKEQEDSGGYADEDLFTSWRPSTWTTSYPGSAAATTARWTCSAGRTTAFTTTRQPSPSWPASSRSLART